MAGEKRPVLVVEDDPDIREATATLLEDEGYAVAQADNGLRALERMQQDPIPTLILLDLMMPVMDGLEFLEKLAQLEPARAKVPVVVLTAAHNPVVAQARRVIRKPYEVDTLLDAVEQFRER